MERKFKCGDKVRLVSDTEENVVMTVRGYALELAMEDRTASTFLKDLHSKLDGLVTCDWRDKSNIPYTKNYKEDELIKCE